MIPKKIHHREQQYRPQAGKTLHLALMAFIQREFPRLGGPWIVELFVDKLLAFVDNYRIARGRLMPGQTLWPAVALDERPAQGKPLWRTRQVPVIITIAGQDQIQELRANERFTDIVKRALVRACHDAYAQGGVLTTTDLGVLFHRSHGRIAEMICQYEEETGELVPRRGTIHDLGGTVTHKRLICRKAYLEGKPTHVIARETTHSPEAVDHYVLDFARVYFATVERGMSLEEAIFAIQRPRYVVAAYVRMIAEFGLTREQVYDRSGVALELANNQIEPALAGNTLE